MRHVVIYDWVCHTYEWVMLQIWTGRVTHMNQTCHTYERDTSHTYMYIYVYIYKYIYIYIYIYTKKKNWCHTKAYVTSQTWVSPVTYMNGTCRACEWFMLHKRLSHAAHRNVSVTHSIFFLKTNGRVCMGPVTYINKFHATISHMNHSCHKYGWVMSHEYIRHVTNVKESCHTCEWDVSHMRMNQPAHITCMDTSCHTNESVMSHV